MYKHLQSDALNRLITNYRIGTVLIQFTLLVFPLSMYLVYNKIIASKNPNGLLLIMIFLSLILVIQTILKIITSIQKNIIKTDLLIKQQERYIDYSFKSDASNYDHHNNEKIISDLSFKTDEQISNYASSSFYLFIIIYFVLILTIGKYLVLVPLCLFSLNYLFMKDIAKKNSSCKELYKESLNKKNVFLKEVFLKAKIIKSLNINDKIIQKYKNLTYDSNKYKSYYSYIKSKSARISLGFNIVNMSFIVIFGRYLYSLQMISIEEVITCSLLTVWISKPISQIFSNMTEPNDSEDIVDTLAEEPPEMTTDGSDFFDENMEIENELINIKNQLNKQSLLYVDQNSDLNKLYKMLIIDNQNVSYINSDYKIFYASIIDNITLFNTELSDFAKKLCKAVGLDNLINNLPFQYNYVATGKHDEALTKDMLIFISIIREILIKPELIIIDINISTLNQAILNNILKYTQTNNIKIICMKHGYNIDENNLINKNQ